MTDLSRGAVDRASHEQLPVNSPNVWLAAYNQLVAIAAIGGIGLLKSSSELHPERLGNGENLQLSIPPPEYRAVFDQKAGIIQCGVRLRAIVGTTPNEGEAAVRIDAEYVLNYTVPAGTEIPEVAIQAFAYRNGVFNAWPFFRELVFSMSSRMSVPGVLVPLFRLPVVPQAAQ